MHAPTVTLQAIQRHADVKFISFPGRVMNALAHGRALILVAVSARLDQVLGMCRRQRIRSRSHPMLRVTSRATGSIRLVGLVIAEFFQMLPMDTRPKLIDLVRLGSGLVLFHVLGIGMAVPAEDWHIGWFRNHSQPIGVAHGMSLVDLGRIRIAAMAVVTPQASLPMDVPGDIGRCDEQMQRLAFPDFAIAVTEYALVRSLWCAGLLGNSRGCGRQGQGNYQEHSAKDSHAAIPNTIAGVRRFQSFPG